VEVEAGAAEGAAEGEGLPPIGMQVSIQIQREKQGVQQKMHRMLVFLVADQRAEVSVTALLLLPFQLPEH